MPESTIPPQYANPSGTTPDPETADTATRMDTPLMREPLPTPEERHAYDTAVRNRNATLKAMVITLAVVMAPFIGLLYDLKIGIGLLGLGLLFTTFVTWSGANRMNPSQRTRARISAGLNGVLALVALTIFAMMTANG